MLRHTVARFAAQTTVGLRTASIAAVRSKHTLPDLTYDYGALEPHISGEIMKIHHSKHHQTYVNALNIAEERQAELLAKGDVSGAIENGQVIKFNGGGHLNHSIFWTNLAPKSQGGGDPPTGELLDLIVARWGSLEEFQAKFSAKTAAVQGSGWGWLGYNRQSKALEIATCPNQDPLEATTGLVPLLGVDVWEHAYYLQYKNVRPDYLKAIWEVVNWSDVNARFLAAKDA